MKTRYPHLASLIFERPLMVERRKLSVIVNALAPRLGLDVYDESDDPVPRREREATPVVDGIAVIEVFGSLVKRTRGMEAESGLRSYEDIENELLEAATNPRVSGILLDIDSGGGDANGAFDLSDLIYSLRQQTPIYAIANDNALSAAYAIASAAERLFVTQTGMVGSVGVIALHCDQSGFDKNLGVKYTPITFGERKNDFSPHEPLSDEATDVLQAEVNRLGQLFVSTVARNRIIDAEAVRGTQAGLLSPDEAIAAGFADEVGTRSDAIGALNQQIATGRRRTPVSRMRRAAEQPSTRFLHSPASAEEHSTEQEDTTVSNVANPADAKGTPPPNAAPNPTPAANPAEQPATKMSAQEIMALNRLCQTYRKPKLFDSFLSRNLSFNDATLELANAAADEAGTEIQSQILPDVGTMPAPAGNPNSLIDACKRRIAGMRGGRN